MISIGEATLEDVEGIREVFQAEYGDLYSYPQYYDSDVLARMIYTDGTLLMVAKDTESNRVVGTASVVFSVGAHDDLVGEFGRLVVHPDYRGRGIGQKLMKGRIDRVQSRLHVGIVENRASHDLSQRISTRFGFVPVGFIPMKLKLTGRESVAVYVRHFSDSLSLRRNHPRIIPEASLLAGLAFENCGLNQDAIIDDTSSPYPHDDYFELESLRTEGYASLLRIERGRLRHRDVFGPVRLHYGLFQLQARRSDYLIARRRGQVAGGIGYMVDTAERAVRVFELISRTDAPIRFLLRSLLEKCQSELNIEYIDLDVSAYSPRMQRTLLELGFLPSSYVPANVFHEVERLDAIRMVRLFVPLDLGELEFCDEMKPIAESVIDQFAGRRVLPRIVQATRRAPLFAGLSSEQGQRLLAIFDSQNYDAGEFLFRSGESDRRVHLILGGEVQLVAKDQAIGTVVAGQCVGETSLLQSTNVHPTHSVDAVAKTNVESASFTIDDFRVLVRRHPDLGVVIYRNLAADISAKLVQARR